MLGAFYFSCTSLDGDTRGPKPLMRMKAGTPAPAYVCFPLGACKRWPSKGGVLLWCLKLALSVHLKSLASFHTQSKSFKCTVGVLSYLASQHVALVHVNTSYCSQSFSQSPNQTVDFNRFPNSARHPTIQAQNFKSPPGSTRSDDYAKDLNSWILSN